MDPESSLLWNGPIWYAGREPPIRNDENGHVRGVDLVAAFHGDADLPPAIPPAIIVETEHLRPDFLSRFLKWLQEIIRSFHCEVPYFLLTDGSSPISDATRPTAILDCRIPDDVLFLLICVHQRSLLRFEEARVRRSVFGRIPGYGTAPHYAGTSGLLIVGLSGRFMKWQQAIDQKVEVIGALDGAMAAEFLSQRAFDAVIVDTSPQDAVDNMRLIRRDPRFAALPILAVSDHTEDIPELFRLGASDVLYANGPLTSLSRRVAVSIRFGKRRRLADRALAESQRWLQKQVDFGGLAESDYTQYINYSSELLGARGLHVHEMRLLPEHFNIPFAALDGIDDLYGLLLSIASATSREEDLVCFVEHLGPVAVLKNEAGQINLQKRINAILQHTVI